jgi:hypothetical protein
MRGVARWGGSHSTCTSDVAGHQGQEQQHQPGVHVLGSEPNRRADDRHQWALLFFPS